MRVCELTLQTDQGDIKVEVFAKDGFSRFHAKSPVIEEELEDSDVKALLDKVMAYMKQRYVLLNH